MLSLKDGFDRRFLSGSESDLVQACQQITETKEFKDGMSIVENNICHNHESLFNHSLYVFDRFQDFLTLKFIRSKFCKKKAQIYFSKKIGKHNSAELFLMSALLHDLGKSQTIILNGGGTTSTVGHETKSVEISKKILKQFKYGNEETEYLLAVIKQHSGYTLRFLDFMSNLSKKELQGSLSSVALLPEIFLYMIADNESADSFKGYKVLIQSKFLQDQNIYNKNYSFDGSELVGSLIEKVLTHLMNTSKPWPTETRLFHLSEEVGELHDIYLQLIGAKDRVQSLDDIQNALNDVLLETLALYESFGVNIKNSLEKILKENDK